VISKYADDTNLLVPQHTDIPLNDEFDAIKLWATNNKMTINIAKTKELVFRRPNPRLQLDDLSHVHCIEQVKEAKLLGVIFKDNLRFDLHVNSILKQCSQRSFLLKQLRSQGLSKKQLNTVFDAIIVSRLRYALPAWGGFLSKELEGRIDAFLRRMFLFGYCSQLHSVQQFIARCDETLFHTLSQPSHCLYQLLPPFKDTSKPLRSRGHNFVLPSCHFDLYKKSFINRCLFNYV
jgi:hypothetical protein